MIPGSLDSPFMAIKAGRRALEVLRKSIGGLVFLENPSGELYGPDYKDDNIFDELRLRLENRVLGSMASDAILIDGPIYPVQLAHAETFSERYYRAFEALFRERSDLIRRLVGVVKRLEYTYKLYRVDEVRKLFEGVVGSVGHVPDPVVVSRLAGGRKLYSIGILREVFGDVGHRYMIYFYVKSPSGPRVFRVESIDKAMLTEVAGYLLKSLSDSGLPRDIEIADRISKRLSASAYIALYTLGSRILGVGYDEISKLSLTLGEIGGERGSG